MTSPIETNNVVERLIARLRERPSQFECATYKALQAGSADKHQQQSAASGIALAHARFSEAADLIQSLSDRIDVLEGENGRLRRCLLPVHMMLAQAECVDEPIPDDAVVLHFMGSGASDQVTAGEVRASLTQGGK